MATKPPPRRPATLVAPIKWATDFGWIAIYDRAQRVWHEVPADAVPRWWKQAAMAAKNGE